VYFINETALILQRIENKVIVLMPEMPFRTAARKSKPLSRISQGGRCNLQVAREFGNTWFTHLVTLDAG